jgi:hypothetical protein
MATYFDQFPKIIYNISGDRYRKYETITEIMFRIGIIKNTLNNISAYFNYTISDDETPEILAGKIYGDPETYWIILYANDIIDPAYDWPMNNDVFYYYMIDKYRPLAEADAGQDQTDNQVIAWTRTNYHHHEKIVERRESATGITTTQKFQINEANLTSNLASSLSNVPYDYYNNLEDEAAWTTIDMGGNKTVLERAYRERVSYYDYEEEKNENKRFIKIIKPDYYPAILAEYEQLVNPDPIYLRRL